MKEILESMSSFSPFSRPQAATQHLSWPSRPRKERFTEPQLPSDSKVTLSSSFSWRFPWVLLGFCWVTTWVSLGFPTDSSPIFLNRTCQLAASTRSLSAGRLGTTCEALDGVAGSALFTPWQKTQHPQKSQHFTWKQEKQNDGSWAPTAMQTFAFFVMLHNPWLCAQGVDSFLRSKSGHLGFQRSLQKAFLEINQFALDFSKLNSCLWDISKKST